VVTVNYTQLAVLGAEFIGGAIGQLRQRGVEVFDVSAEAEEGWTKAVVDTFVDSSAVMSACTPSRINNEGHPEALNPRNTNYGRGFGDWFGYRDLLEQWLEAGTLEGLELRVRSTAS
jgi:cyclohexanone monooxygenase/pentalenolactone D synthase